MDSSFLGSTSEPQSTEAIRRSLYETWKELADVRERIRSITEEMEKGSVSLQNLRETEKELLKIAAAKAPFLSPFQHPPRDVLAEIVEKVLSIDNDISRVNRGIWPLTHVCSSWRSSILSLPQLWSSFSIPYRITPKLELVSRALERSNNHPLSFSVDAQRAKHVYQLMLLLVGHSTRWRSVELMGRIPPVPLLDIHNRLPLLENLSLGLCETRTDEDVWLNKPRYQTIFAVAPRLRSITLRSDCFFQFEFPTQQLCTAKYPVRLIPGSSDNLVCIRHPLDLPHCSNLLSLHIESPPSFLHDDPRILEEAQEIVLPALKRLRVIGRTGILLVLHILRSPSLRRLELDDVRIDTERLCALQTFLDSIPGQGLSSFGISVMETDDVSASHMDALFSLPVFRSLHELTVRRRPSPYSEYVHPQDNEEERPSPVLWIKPFLSRSVYKGPDTALDEEEPPLLFPCLRRFTLDFEHQSEDGVIETLREFILSRTALIGETDPSQGGTSDRDDSKRAKASIPSRLQDVYIKCNKSSPPMTLSSFNRLEARVRSMTCQSACKILPSLLFSHLAATCPIPLD